MAVVSASGRRARTSSLVCVLFSATSLDVKTWYHVCSYRGRAMETIPDGIATGLDSSRPTHRNGETSHGDRGTQSARGAAMIETETIEVIVIVLDILAVNVVRLLIR